jgi:hypothetical protein
MLRRVSVLRLHRQAFALVRVFVLRATGSATFLTVRSLPDYGTVFQNPWTVVVSADLTHPEGRSTLFFRVRF